MIIALSVVTLYKEELKATMRGRFAWLGVAVILLAVGVLATVGTQDTWLDGYGIIAYGLIPLGFIPIAAGMIASPRANRFVECVFTAPVNRRDWLAAKFLVLVTLAIAYYVALVPMMLVYNWHAGLPPLLQKFLIWTPGLLIASIVVGTLISVTRASTVATAANDRRQARSILGCYPVFAARRARLKSQNLHRGCLMVSQDMRYAARGLRRNSGFTLVVVLSLALGIGANTAIFSVLNAVLLRPLPVVHPAQLYALDITESRFRAPQRFSYPLFEQMRGSVGGEVAAMSRVARMYSRLTGEGEQEITRVQLVSGEYFTLLGLAPARGRFLGPKDNLTIGQHPVAVVSHAFWQGKLGGFPNVVGRSVDLNGAHFTIVGVAPPGFNGLWLESPVDVWIPLMMQATVHYQQNFSSRNSDEDKPWANQEGIRWLDLIVRTERNLPALQGVFQQWLEAHARQVVGIDRQLFLRQRLILDPLGQGYSNVRGQIEAPLYALAGMVALVLLIACANSLNLILGAALSVSARSRCAFPSAPAVPESFGNCLLRVSCSWPSRRRRAW
jgi:hypothetical protein